MSAVPVRAGRDWPAFIAVAGWLGTWFVARAAAEQPSLPQGLRVGLVLLPIPFFALFLWRLIQGVRSMGELDKQVHLEALVVAYPLTMILLMTLGLLELVVPLSRDDWSYRHVWAMLPTFYLLGLALAWRRYK